MRKSKLRYVLVTCIVLSMTVSGCSCNRQQPVVNQEVDIEDTVPTIAPTATPEPTATPVPTNTPTPEPTATPVPMSTPTPEPTATPVPTNTPTPEPTATPVPTNTPTPEPTATPKPTKKPTATPKPTKKPTTTPKPTATPTPKVEFPKNMYVDVHDIETRGETNGIDTYTGSYWLWDDPVYAPQDMQFKPNDPDRTIPGEYKYSFTSSEKITGDTKTITMQFTHGMNTWGKYNEKWSTVGHCMFNNGFMDIYTGQFVFDLKEGKSYSVVIEHEGKTYPIKVTRTVVKEVKPSEEKYSTMTFKVECPVDYYGAAVVTTGYGYDNHDNTMKVKNQDGFVNFNELDCGAYECLINTAY